MSFGNVSVRVYAFGLMNAPSTFQRMVFMIFFELPFVSVYLDDVVMFSLSTQECEKNLGNIIDFLSGHRLKLKVPKCELSVLG